METIHHFPEMSKNWVNTTADKIMAFLGIVIFMGIIKLPKISMYFRPESLPSCCCIDFHQKLVFSANELSSCISSYRSTSQRLSRLQRLWSKTSTDTLSRRFEQINNTDCEQSTDKAIVNIRVGLSVYRKCQ